nr:putative ribonuclease H-like domain-containing protein [Tanacetum cinerariifolium]
MVTASSTGLVHTARTKRPQPKGNTRNDRIPSASKSSEVKKNVIVEDHRRTLLLSKNKKSMSSECNNIKLAIRNENFEIVCDTCKQCLVTANHDTCFPSSVNVLNSHANNLCVNVPLVQIKRDIGHRLSKFVCGIVRFGNEHIAAILGYGDLKWGNITITRVYFVEDYQSLNMLKNIFVPLVSKKKEKEPLTHPNRFRIQSSGFICFTWTCVVQCELQALMKIFVRLQAPVIIIRTDKGTEFKNHVLKEYFDSFGITHEISTAITPQKNGVVECKNRTLVEAARTMLIFSHAPLFLWVEAIATACYTQNRSIIHGRFNKHHTSSSKAENRTSLTFMFLGLSVILRMIVKISVNLVQKVILASSLDILPLHNEFLGRRPSDAPRTIHVAPVLQNL